MFDAHVDYRSEPFYSRLEREADEAHKAGVRWAVNAPVGSISFVPTVFGCVMASWVVRSLLDK